MRVIDEQILSTILLGAGLIFEAGDKLKAQESECVKYNHDQDDFQEEIISSKTKEPNKKEMAPIVTRVVV